MWWTKARSIVHDLPKNTYTAIPKLSQHSMLGSHARERDIYIQTRIRLIRLLENFHSLTYPERVT